MTANQVTRKRRQPIKLEERGVKVAEALARLQEEARSYARAATSETASDLARTNGTAWLARRAIQYAKAIERARDER